MLTAALQASLNISVKGLGLDWVNAVGLMGTCASLAEAHAAA